MSNEYERSHLKMKEKYIRKNVQQAEDKLEAIQRKMRHLEGALFFIALGLESFYQCEDCYEVDTIQAVRDYIKTLTEGELTELEKRLEHLKKD